MFFRPEEKIRKNKRKAKKEGDTPATVPVQALVDRGEMSLHTADELTSLNDEEQNAVARVVSEHGLHLGDRQLRRLKQAAGT